MKYPLSIFAGLILCLSANFVAAQFLPANQVPQKPLTQEILTRWIATNKAIREYQVLIEEMLPTDKEAQAFDQLSLVEQDKIVNQYLQKKGKFEPLNSKIRALGWTGVADYMRTSSQIGNAIAADLEAERLQVMTPQQAKAILDKTDPAVKSVTKADLEFIRANKSIISQHIQSYSNVK